MERYAVIGLGRFGRKLATLLAEAGAEVIAVDRQKESVDAIRDTVALAVALDSTDREALRVQGIHQVDVAVVGIGSNFEANLLTTTILKELGAPRVISRATTDRRARILSRIGADSVANPELESAERWRSRLLAPRIMERIELEEGYSMTRLAAPESFFGKSLVELDVRRSFESPWPPSTAPRTPARRAWTRASREPVWSRSPRRTPASSPATCCWSSAATTPWMRWPPSSR
jgi:trk system potassium uptake protein TrkA